MKKILMVCTANICRSPIAKAVLQKIAADAGEAALWHIDSAGTHAQSNGERADPRGEAALKRQGYTASKHKSRAIQPQDFENFDLLLAMDSANLESLQRRCPPQHLHKLHLLLAYAPQTGTSDIPDPYYSNAQGFDRVLALCEAGSKGLFSQLSTRSA